ncbi:glycosyltransferase family 2 protein [Marinobacter sp. C2H3]|uniref:glycosyltransferase family 2 protein n=1 Tax=Marinobacter sp. C2H3 TaxID=3119003 RepID=UPI00300F0E8D
MNDVLVVIPCYNNFVGLSRTIASIDVNDCADILVVDDGSDNEISDEDLREYQSECRSIKVLRNVKNEGVAVSLNKGVQFADQNGYRYIARLDAGDRNLGARLSLQRRFLDANEDYIIVGSWVKFVSESGKTLFILRHPCNDGQIRNALFRYNPFVHPSVMIRVSALTTVQGYPEEYPALEDWACFINLSKIGKLCNLPEVLLEYEVSADSVSSKKRYRQNLSKVKLLWAHFRWTPVQIIGLTKAIALLLIPRKPLTVLKQCIIHR